MGCTATAIVGAFLGRRYRRVPPAIHGLTVLGVAGEIAAERVAGARLTQVQPSHAAPARRCHARRPGADRRRMSGARRSARLTPRLAFDLSLYLVVGPNATAGRDVTSVALAAVRGGATMVQLRYKAGTSEIMQAAREVIEVLRPTGVPVIINDRVDLARALGAQGVHVGQGDTSPAEARRVLGEDAITGARHRRRPAGRRRSELVDLPRRRPVFPTGLQADAAPPLRSRGLCVDRALGSGSPSRRSAASPRERRIRDPRRRRRARGHLRDLRGGDRKRSPRPGGPHRHRASGPR